MLINIIIYLFSLIIKLEGIHLYKEEIVRSGQTYGQYQFNILHHLSGISPYFESNNDELNPDPPEGCTIDKTAYLIRHGSVYADDYDYDYIIKPFLEGLNKSLNKIDFSKSSELSFLTEWTSPISDRNKQIEKLTKSGILEAFKLGVELSYRYPKLLPNKNQSSFKVWTSSSQRTKQSALAIFNGLFAGQKPIGRVIDILETKNRGANSLTPTKTCKKFHSSTGSKEAKTWLQHYTKPILEKFNSKIVNLNFSSNDILAMQELCGYETVIRGYSPFCRLFTTEEWICFEYYFDIKYYYELGYGNNLSPYLGIHWIKATTQLFNNQFYSNQNIYLSIAHREMIPIILVALGLYNQSEYFKGKSLPLDQINHERLWKSSKMIPFLGRVALERLSCSSVNYNGSFVRILVNSLSKPVAGCSQGPGGSCPLQNFIDYVDKRYQLYKNFSKICQIENKNKIDHLTFFNDDH
jgi:hypothetical protein